MVDASKLKGIAIEADSVGEVIGERTPTGEQPLTTKVTGVGPSGTQVQVMLMSRDPFLNPGLPPYFMRVKVRSNKPIFSGALWGHADVEIENSEAFMRRKCSVAAAAIAEDQIEKYADRHDPSEVERAAREAFDNLIANLKQRGLFQ